MPGLDRAKGAPVSAGGLGSFLLGGVLLAASACTGPAADRLEVEGPRVRATPPGAEASAAFMTLRSTGAAVRLVAAKASVGQSAELHAHLEEGGVMRMRPVAAIEVPAKGTVRLEPGGLHVMLLGLGGPLEVGQKVELTLVLADGSLEVVEAPVVAIEAPEGVGHGGGGAPEPHDHGPGGHQH